MQKNLAKTYNPKEFEERIYQAWESHGTFSAKRDPKKKPFTIVMPPPNITGQLHMGHALDQTLQDVLIRFKRLQGFSSLWVPGSDHASIATEVKVVEKLRNDEGLEKEDIGRDEFLKRAWQWKELYGGKITQQCRKLGDSCDWERERFTMDEGCNRAVTEFFVRLYEKGLIYRGNRLINWCPECGSALSDAEVEHEDKNGLYWYFKYPAADGGEGVVVATSRPETMFADVAVAVHPEDSRYVHLIGKKVILPLVGKEIPVIADTYPDPEKGTGAVKITPAHDPNDFEVGQRHGLDSPVCIDMNAKMTASSGKYEGMDRFECRKAWIKELEQEGYLVKTEEKVIPTGGCYRCNTVVEPMLSDQWFVAMEELAKPAIEVTKKGELKHVPDRFEKTYLHWLENIRDWCISRQLWWGHRIPAYYCEDCGHMMVSQKAPSSCEKCGGNLHQDEDVLDTWFSSALWPFSTLGWPQETPDYKYFYPTDVLVTGYDIIFFWVVRMVFSALEATGECPFHSVFVHGLVRDGEGRKMSKSLGNGIDPLEIIDQYGADALRFTLTTGVTPGNDMRFKSDRLESSRNFANKLWNASRFVIMNLKDEGGNFYKMSGQALREEDKWMLHRVNEAVLYTTRMMEKFDLALAGQRVYELIWNEFCDWYIELVKERLYGSDEQDKMVVRWVLVEVLREQLRLLHPFMPFITEEIWSHLPAVEKEENPEGFLICDQWPRFTEERKYENSALQIEKAMELIRAIRNVRAEADAPMSKKLKGVLYAEENTLELLERGLGYVKNLGNMSEIRVTSRKEDIPEDAMSGVIEGASIYISRDDLLDYEAEYQRLTKERARLEQEVSRLEGKLKNQGFLAKAPEEVVREEKEKQEKYEDMLQKVKTNLALVEKKRS
jgi:valyl-tRNA synthetase